MVNQLQPLAILMVIQGVFECLMGSLWFVGMFLLGMQGPIEEIPEGSLIYGVIGIGALVAGVLKITAGVCTLHCRERLLSIVALACGILAFPTVLCAPTGLGVMIYGLIVYLDGDVAKAFAMSKQCKASQEIRSTLARLFEYEEIDLWKLSSDSHYPSYGSDERIEEHDKPI